MEYRVGDLIVYNAFGGERRKVKVTNRETNIKNGRPGFDGEVVGVGAEVWGYDDQIIDVIWKEHT